MSCTCPAGQQTQKVVSISSGDRYGAPGVPLRAFRFDAAVCDGCPLRPKCVRARPGKGRLVMIHPQEALLQEARAFQKSESFAPYRKLRQVAEHRLARMMQLGVRQARYFGRTKTLFQLLIAASVANLTLVARRVGLMRDRNHLPDGSLYTRLCFICVSLRVRNSVATLGARVFGHASRGWSLLSGRRASSRGHDSSKSGKGLTTKVVRDYAFLLTSVKPSLGRLIRNPELSRELGMRAPPLFHMSTVLSST